MKTFTSLVGTTTTTSPSTYGGAFTTLVTNNSANVVATGKSLVNDQHRYLLQKYFDNERTVTLSTVGSATYTVTAAPVNGATSATLSTAYTQTTGYQYTNFSDGEQRNVLYTNGSTAISWSTALVVSTTLTTTINALGIQYYNIPADCSKIKNDTINVGQLKYQPVFIASRQEWDKVNFLPYNSDIPNYCFIYNGQIGIFPIPSTTGNILTFNYKCRVPDFTFADYSTGTLAAGGMVAGSTAVTGLATTWNTVGGFPLNTNITFWNLYLRADPPYGDGMWYPISQFNSDTTLTLSLPVVNAPNITAATTYTIGQMPLLQEDFHDMIVYGAAKVYYTSIVKDKDSYMKFDGLFKERLELLKEYDGTKQVNVDLEGDPLVVNPNLFIYQGN